MGFVLQYYHYDPDYLYIPYISTRVNSIDPDQTAPYEQFDQGLHYLPSRKNFVASPHSDIILLNLRILTVIGDPLFRVFTLVVRVFALVASSEFLFQLL